MSGRLGLKPFRWPWLWLALWLLAIAAVIVLSLVNLSGLPPVPEGGDKVEHFVAYTVLSAVAVQLFATRRGCFIAAALLVGLGIALEFAQGGLTATRMADLYDALANTLGVLAGLTTMLTPARQALLAIDARLLPARA